MTDNVQLDESVMKRIFGPRASIAGFLTTVVLLLFAAGVILPLLIPFMFAFKTQLEFSYHPWSLPQHLLLTNFVDAWTATHIGQGMLNTVFVCVGAIVTTVPPAAMAGYIFSRYQSKVTEVFFYIILAGWFVPIQMVLIPLYRLTVSVGLVNSLPGLFLPMAAFGIPFWTLIYRSFFRSLPNELADAARIDGAGHPGTFFQVMLPLAGPATVLAVLLVFIGAWSDYLLSLIMLNNSALFTMQLRVGQFLGQYGTDRMPRYAAAAIIAAAPTIILYIIGHRWVLRETLAGALKG